MFKHQFTEDGELLWGRVSNEEAIEDEISTIDLLEKELEKEEEVKEEEEIEEEKEEIKLDEEEKDEEEEIKLDEDEEITGPPRKKEIEKFAPGFFKKFPEMERAYYRDKQFVETIGTLDDAKELVEKARILEDFETDLESAATDKILKQVKENNPEAFAKIAETYIENLAKVDQDAYYHVVEKVLKRGIFGALTQAKNNDDEDLHKAALKFYKFMFPGDTEIKPVSTLVKKDEESDKLKKEREAFVQERFETAQKDLQGRIDNKIKNTIDAHIDPKGLMTPYVKKNAIKDAIGEIERTINADSNFKKTVLDPLWKKAYEEKFSRASLDRIGSAYLSKTKSIIKPAIQKARVEALKGLGKREEKDRKGPIIPGRTSTSSNKSSGKVPEIKKGMSTFDILNSE